MEGYLEPSPKIDFEVEKKVEVDPRVEDAAKKAISMVWERNVGEPQRLRLVFVSLLADPVSGKILDLSSEYNPDTDSIVFALDTMRERMNFGLPEKDSIILIAAHEAVHKVQFHRKEEPVPSVTYRDREGNLTEQYIEDRHEIEAWEEALHVFKKIYPKSKGHFYIGKRRYDIPERSKY